MTSYEGDQFLIAVDCVIFGFDGENLKLLLVKRAVEPCFGQWSLMGGFLQTGEDLKSAADRVLQTLTGLEGIYMDQVGTFGKVNRDEGGRVVSVVYDALINPDNQTKQLSKDFSAAWFPMQALPPLVFDHMDMVNAAKQQLRYKAEREAVGFNLLPEKFTMLELQNLYEAIFERSFDKRNFSKQMLAMGGLQRLDEKDKSTSRKGSYYYQFTS